jgi:uncharacterized protein YaaQ
MEQAEHELTDNRLVIAVVQGQDAENVLSILTKSGVPITRLPSTGGFLGQHSVTLFIMIPRDQEGIVIQAFNQCCRTRIEYITLPAEGSPMPLSAPIPITVGGAALFFLDIEEYIEVL